MVLGWGDVLVQTGRSPSGGAWIEIQTFGTRGDEMMGSLPLVGSVD